MPTYRFLESGVFSVTVEVEASSEEEAREILDDGDGIEVESLEYYGVNFELLEVIDD